VEGDRRREKERRGRTHVSVALKGFRGGTGERNAQTRALFLNSRSPKGGRERHVPRPAVPRGGGGKVSSVRRRKIGGKGESQGRLRTKQSGRARPGTEMSGERKGVRELARHTWWGSALFCASSSSPRGSKKRSVEDGREKGKGHRGEQPGAGKAKSPGRNSWSWERRFRKDGDLQGGNSDSKGAKERAKRGRKPGKSGKGVCDIISAALLNAPKEFSGEVSVEKSFLGP